METGPFLGPTLLLRRDAEVLPQPALMGTGMTQRGSAELSAGLLHGSPVTGRAAGLSGRGTRNRPAVQATARPARSSPWQAGRHCPR